MILGKLYERTRRVANDNTRMPDNRFSQAKVIDPLYRFVRQTSGKIKNIGRLNLL